MTNVDQNPDDLDGDLTYGRAHPSAAQRAAEALRLAREWNEYWRAQNETKLVRFTDLVIAALEAEAAQIPVVTADMIERGVHWAENWNCDSPRNDEEDKVLTREFVAGILMAATNAKAFAP